MRTRWSAGDIIYFSVLQKSVIVVNSAEVAHDLLEKRSSIYSCRPHVPMAGDVYGACFFLPFRLSADILKMMSIRLESVGTGLCLSSLTAKLLNGIAGIFNNILRSRVFRNTTISKGKKLIVYSTIFWRIQRTIGLILNGKFLVVLTIILNLKIDQLRGSHYHGNRLWASS